MPRVPSAEAQVRQAAVPGARMGAQYSPDTFGASIGEAAQHASRVYTEVYRQEKQRADQIAENEFTNKLSEAQRKYEQAGLALQGKDAFGAADRLRADYDKESGEIEKTLANQEQRDAFHAQREARGQQLYGRLVSHTMQQQRQFDEQETTGNIANLTKEAVDDPASAAAKIAEIRAKIGGYSQRNGMPASYTEMQTGKAVSATHRQVIDAIAASGDSTGARNYFNGVKGELLPGADREHAEATVTVSGLRADSQQIADDILAKVTGGETLTLMQQVDLAKEAAGNNAELRDEAVRRVRDNARMLDESKQRRVEQLYGMADEMIRDSGNLDDVDPGVWAQLPSAQREQILQTAAHIRNGTKPATDWDLWYDLMDAASSDDPAKRNQFMHADLAQSRNSFADSEFKELTKLQQSMRNGDGSEREMLDGYRTTESIVTDTLKGIKKAYGNPESDKDRAAVSRFKQMVDERVAAWKHANKSKTIGSPEVQKIVDELTIKTADEDDWFTFSNAYVFEAKDADAVPAEERIKIMDYLMRHGQPTDPKRIAELYQLKLRSPNAGK